MFLAALEVCGTVLLIAITAGVATAIAKSIVETIREGKKK